MSGWPKPPANDDATVVLPRPGARPPGPVPPQRPSPGGLATLLRIVRWTSLVLALIFAAAGGIFALSTYDFVGRAVGAEAVVARLAERDGSYAPVFRFRTAEGREVEIIHTVSSNPPMWRAGQTLRLLYDPQDPQTGAPDGWWSLWIMPVVLGGVALVLLATFAALSVFGPRRTAAAGR